MTRLRPPTAFAYDVFVVHAAADESFVRGYLLAKLGLPSDRVFLSRRLTLGASIAEEIERGVRSSRVTIVVLSSAYMDDPWAAFGQQLATNARVAGRGHGALLPLLLEDCALAMYIQALVPLDFRDPTREAWEAEIERLRAYLDQPATPEPELPCPYPGMRPFTESDAGRFFGRDAELDHIVRRLRRGEREIYLIGASGSGKSSLIAAGLLPRLARTVDGLPRFHVQTLRPGERPVDRLAAALDGEVGSATAVASAIGALLARNPPATSLLLVIDQLEELFAIAGDGARRDFLEALHPLRADPRCVLVFALRADFYGSFMDSALWTDRQGRISHVEVGPLRSDSLRAAIEQPARELEVYFQAELVSRLLDDAAREPGALPLLQETLFQLWGKRRHRLLALADYHAMSDGTRTGLAFAVKEHADIVLGALTEPQKTLAYRILLRLVNFGEGRADTRRQQPRAALRSDGDAAADFDAVLRCLVDNRLVTVTGDDHRGDVRVDLAHEIVIQAWTTFAEWIQPRRMHEQRRRELEAAAANWRTRGSGDGGLLDAVELAAALAWRDKAAQELGTTIDLATFLAASEVAQADAVARERKQREDRNRLLAESSQLCQETGRQRLVEAERPLEALPYLVAARQATEASGGALSSSLRMLFATAIRNLPVSPPLEHQGGVSCAAFSPDGRRVITASEDQVARIWDVATGRPLTPPLEHEGAVISAAFSPDGALVVTSGWDRTARIWDADTGKPRTAPLKHHGVVESAAFSPDSRRVVTASRDGTARIWEATTGMPLTRPLKHRAGVTSAAFSPDGARIVTAGEDRMARVWDAVTGAPCSSAPRDMTARSWDAVVGDVYAPALEHQGAVLSAAFDAAGTRIVTASEDRTARVWDATTGLPLSPPLRHDSGVTSAAFSADGRQVVTASEDRTAHVWNAATDKLRVPPLAHQGAVRSAAFSADGTRVVTASIDHTARVWSAVTGEPLSGLLGHQGSVVSAAFSADGTRVVTASEDRTALVWSIATAEPVTPPLVHQRTVVSAAFSPDGSRIVTASRDNTARVWDAATGRPVSPPLQHDRTVESAAFSLDGTRIITASGDYQARIWDLAGAVRPLQLKHDELVWSAAFSPDDTRAVTTSWDRTARIWCAVTGEELFRLEHQRAVWHAAFSPDGRRVVTASGDKAARIWDAATGKPLSPPLEHHDTVWSAAFSPDGSRVVTASNDHTARIWDAATGKPLSSSLGHRDIVRSAVFSPDGTCVITASADGTARLWDLPLASGSLADWLAIADRASHYILANGVLSARRPRSD